MRIRSAVLALMTAAALGGCDLEVPDLANPGLEDLEENPNRANVTAAATGLLIGSRGNYAAANGYVSQLGILGRESYNFDPADPRFVGELLGGNLNSGSPFGGNFWAGPYANIRQVHIVVGAVDQVAAFSEEEKAGIRGFARTIHALDLLEVITTRDDNGVVIDTDRPIGDIGPITGKQEGLDFVADLLDEGAMDLADAGDAFAFGFGSGFAGFDTPATFLTFNRALRVRVAAYQEDYETVLAVLADTFIVEPTTVAELDIGVYYSYSNGPGDATNGLINPNIYAHPSLADLVETNATTDQVDARYARKVGTTDDPGVVEGRESALVFTHYGPTAPVPIIRNEELILLRAEANFFTDGLPAAIEDINLIRTLSGGLEPRADLTEDNFLDDLLYNRLYSLLFEGGHRWIDVRRFDRVDDLPLDLEGDQRNIRYPIPLPECNARPGEPACERGSV